MPGLGCSMGMVQRLEQRQVLTLRQRMELRQELILAQRMLETLEQYEVRDDDAKIETAQCERYLNTEFDLATLLEQDAKAPSDKHSMQLAVTLRAARVLFPQTALQDMVLVAKRLADGDERPSEILRRVVTAFQSAQAAPEFTALEAAFWQLIVGINDEGALKAAMEWASGLLASCDHIGAAVNLFACVHEELHANSDGFFLLTEQLERELAGRQWPEAALRVGILARLQEKRYESGGIQRRLTDHGLRDLLSHPSTVDRLDRLSHLPIVMAAWVVTHMGMNEHRLFPLLDRLDQLAAEKDFAKSKDYKRTMLRGLQVFVKINDATASLEHLVSLAHSARELIHGFQALEAMEREAVRAERIDYPSHVTSMEQLVLEASDGRRQILKAVFGFSDTELDELYEPKRYTLVQRTGLLDMCVTYGTLCRQHDFARGVELSGEILRQSMAQRFYAWRYSHDKAEDQLGFLSNPEPWKEQMSVSLVLGVSDALTQRIESLRHCGRRLAQFWESAHRYGVDRDLDAEFQGIAALLRQPELPAEQRRQLEAEARRIRREYGLVATIRQLISLTPETMGILASLNDSFRLLRQALPDTEDVRLEFETFVRHCGEMDARGLRRVLIEDTDTPSRTMNVGMNPVRSCQRWIEWTSYNRCLPAYVVDANKRVLYLSELSVTTGPACFGRSVLRMLPITYGREKEVLPLLLLERVYKTTWTNEIGAGVWRWAVLKAETIAHGNDTPVMIGTPDPLLVEILHHALSALKKKARVRKLNIKLPESLNDCEYSDSMGKQLSSGARISNVSLTTFFVE